MISAPLQPSNVPACLHDEMLLNHLISSVFAVINSNISMKVVFKSPFDGLPVSHSMHACAGAGLERHRAV